MYSLNPLYDEGEDLEVYLEGWVCEKSKHKITQPVSSRHLLRRKRAPGPTKKYNYGIYYPYEQEGAVIFL